MRHYDEIVFYYAEKRVHIRRIRMQYVQISVHYDEFTEIFPNSFEICRIAEFGCTISVMGAIVLKLNGKRCM